MTDEELATAETEARAKLAGTPDPVLPGQSAEPTQTPVEELPPVTIEDLTAVYSQAVEANVVTPEQVSEMYLRHGCMEIGDIATNESARRGVVGELQKMIDDKPAGLPGT